MRNQYGAELRGLVADHFAVDAVVTMHDVDAFEDEVSAYPAVVVIRRGEQGPAIVAETTGGFGEVDAQRVTRWAARRPSKPLRSSTTEASLVVPSWFKGQDLWPSGSPTALALLADLEARFAPLEDPATGTRVGIGVATRCDSAYITDDPDLVERDRLLPLLQAADIASGRPDWSGRYLVNPWSSAGLVRLDEYPRLDGHFRANARRLSARHIARSRPAQWYRTIDRVDPTLCDRPKLLLPDMKAAAHPVLDEGGFYPHHNLYFVVSDAWDLEVLGGILLSDIANLFVGAYCVKMRGGTFRFQAQYLRRIRVPSPLGIAQRRARDLAAAFRDRDVERATHHAAQLYEVDASVLRSASAVRAAPTLSLVPGRSGRVQ